MLSLLYMASRGLTPLLISLFLPYTLALPHDNTPGRLASGQRALASCSFEVAGRSFDLCPLFDLEIYAAETHSVSSPSATVAVRADDDAGLELARRGDWFALRSGDLQYRTTKGRKRPCTCLWDGERKALDLLYVPRSHDNLPPSPITFICDPSLAGSGSLVYRKEVEEGGYAFLWRTRHACPTTKAHDNHLESPEVLISKEDSNPPDDDSNTHPEGDSDLLPKPSWRTSRKWIAGFLALFAFAITFSLVLASSPRARFFVLQKTHNLLSLLFYAGSKVAETLGPLKNILGSLLPASLHLPFTFRQGDSRLVQWAEEDMGLQEDFVNGSSAYETQLDGEEWNGNNLDEYIPLNISPKLGRKSYGSTPVRETFSEYARR